MIRESYALGQDPTWLEHTSRKVTMPSRPVITVADNLQLLRSKSKRVKKTDKWIQPLIDDMIRMIADDDHAAGLAAPQLGVLARIIVVWAEKGSPIVLLNPEVIKATDEEEDYEGCLSVPEYYGLVKRATKMTVRAYNRAFHQQTFKANGLLARIVQHEIDHLDGILFIDRIESPNKLFRIARRKGRQVIVEQQELIQV